MPIQTAPSTITVTHADTSTSVLTLKDLTDNLVTYNVTNLKSVDIVGYDQPVMTIARRPGSKNNSGPKHTLRVQHTTFNLLGERTASLLESVDVVRPTTYESATVQTADLTEVVGLVIKSAFVTDMVSDGSFLR